MSSPAGITGVDVRKHRAPKGALRLVLPLALGVKNPNMVRKHRAPKGALRPSRHNETAVMLLQSQKARSAKRCIKTLRPTFCVRVPVTRVRKHRAPKGALRLQARTHRSRCRSCVRKHRAPKGALRPGPDRRRVGRRVVRKHRAPKGALRLCSRGIKPFESLGQKAPSAKRCIKTGFGSSII